MICVARGIPIHAQNSVPPTQQERGMVGEAFAYPAEVIPPVNFVVLSPGAIAVPVGGGVVLAGIGGWLVEPPRRPIISIASPDGVHLIAIQAGSSPESSIQIVRQRSGTRMEVVGTLPAGRYTIASADSTSVWVWGHSASDDVWGLWFQHDDAEPQLLVKSRTPLVAAVPVGKAAIIAGIDSQLLLLESNGSVKSLGRTREVIDGLAIDPAGTVYISSVSGVYAMKQPGQLEKIVAEIHGPIVYANRALFVLSRRHHAVIRLKIS